MSNDPIKIARAEAECKAWDSLARYKFWMFGYHAAFWVKCNRMLPKAERSSSNPFKKLVHLAREINAKAAEANPCELTFCRSGLPATRHATNCHDDMASATHAPAPRLGTMTPEELKACLEALEMHHQDLTARLQQHSDKSVRASTVWRYLEGKRTIPPGLAWALRDARKFAERALAVRVARLEFERSWR